MRTLDAAGRRSSLSVGVSFRTGVEDEAPPSAPGAPEVLSIGAGTRVEVTWPPSADPRVTGYRLYGQTPDGAWHLLVTETIPSTRVEIARSAAAAFTSLAVTAVTFGGNESARSAACSLAASGWSVEGPFPHPVTDGCRVRIHVPADLPPAATLRVEILDLLGRRVAVLHDGAVSSGPPLELLWDRRAGRERAGPGHHYLRMEAPGWRTLPTIYLAP